LPTTVNQNSELASSFVVHTMQILVVVIQMLFV
jgi:hypothetical protein